MNYFRFENEQECNNRQRLTTAGDIDLIMTSQIITLIVTLIIIIKLDLNFVN